MENGPLVISTTYNKKSEEAYEQCFGLKDSGESVYTHRLVFCFANILLSQNGSFEENNKTH